LRRTPTRLKMYLSHRPSGECRLGLSFPLAVPSNRGRARQLLEARARPTPAWRQNPKCTNLDHPSGPRQQGARKDERDTKARQSVLPKRLRHHRHHRGREACSKDACQERALRLVGTRRRPALSTRAGSQAPGERAFRRSVSASRSRAVRRTAKLAEQPPETAHPSTEWMARQLTEACGWESTPKYIVRDRDSVYGEIFTRRLRAMGIRDRPTAPRSPWQNGHTERLIGSIRRECLDHVVALGERHLRHVLLSYMHYYNSARTHLSLNKDAPLPRAVRAVGRILPTPILGGLHHHYVRI
jgi:transposase InsO family protein